VWPELLNEPVEQLSGYRLFAGHFFNLTVLLGRKVITVTVLRHPVQGGISQFGHICRDPNPHLHGLAVELDFDSHRFLSTDVGIEHLRNAQSHHLAATIVQPPTVKPAAWREPFPALSDVRVAFVLAVKVGAPQCNRSFN
jgi:hypothetical protein